MDLEDDTLCDHSYVLFCNLARAFKGEFAPMAPGLLQHCMEVMSSTDTVFMTPVRGEVVGTNLLGRGNAGGDEDGDDDDDDDDGDDPEGNDENGALGSGGVLRRR